jgi:hypothetical protein
MSLKDVIAGDIDAVFFDTDGFSDEAIVDGKAVRIILDNNALNGKSDVYALGLAEGEQLIFIKEKDMPRLPQSGEQMTINGRQWYVRHAISNMGVYEIRIGRDRTYD